MNPAAHTGLPVRAAVLFFGLCLAVFPARAQKLAASPGVTEPFLDVLLSAPVAGTVAKLHVKEGDLVKEGQVLLELRKQQEELEVARRKLLMESKSELDSARAKVDTLKTDLDGTRKLFEATKSVSKDDVMKKELEYKQAVAEVDRLQTAEDREVIEWEIAKQFLAERSLLSPLTGHVVDLVRDVGEDCKAQDPMLRIVDTRQFYFVSNVEARTGYHLKVGQEVRVDVEAGRETVQVKGRINFVSPVVDPASGLLRVKVLCPNTDGKVRPGVAGTMHFPEN
jgi:RND family efflux transporter MFP subunit